MEEDTGCSSRATSRGLGAPRRSRRSCVAPESRRRSGERMPGEAAGGVLPAGRVGWSGPSSLEVGRRMLHVIAAILRPASLSWGNTLWPPQSTPRGVGLPSPPPTYSKFQQSSYFYDLLSIILVSLLGDEKSFSRAAQAPTP